MNTRFYEWMRRALFRMDAESAHEKVMGTFSKAMAAGPVRRTVARRLAVDSEKLRVSALGIDFPNPLGMAAGFDKDGKYFNALGALGFGHIEIGTVTGLAQEGNPKPRLFRLVDDEALLNRMGFNNAGSEAMAQRLSNTKIEPILGINFGKSKVVPLDEAVDDYAASLRRLHQYADYLVVNVSSPNTPGLRKLQGADRLRTLMRHVDEVNRELGEVEGSHRRPVMLKISPDLTDAALDDVLQVVTDEAVDGVIATNTTISRDGLVTEDVDELGNGGVSGRPLTERSRNMVASIFEKTGGELPIFGVGGVFTGEDALAMIEAGATLVQVWTGFIYGGPLVAQQILTEMLELLDQRGYSHISQAVGAAH